LIDKQITQNLSNDAVFNLKYLQQSLNDLETETLQDKFWENSTRSNFVLNRMNKIKQTLFRVKKWNNDCLDISMLLELIVESNKEEEVSLLSEVITTLSNLEKDLSDFETEKLLCGKYDNHGCTFQINAGAGGSGLSTV
jgi:protein subunit release factor A